jgi:hypothetical protein
MIEFQVVIKKFSKQGEKTGWTYIEIASEIAQKLKTGNKKTFRVKGYLDQFYFEGIALLPMGEGNFIMPLNASMRKGIGKRKGAMINVKIALDDKPLMFNKELIECLADEPEASEFFNKLTPGHRRYFSNWIESAKTESTRTTRIARAITAMIHKQDFGAMLRGIKKEKQDLLK